MRWFRIDTVKHVSLNEARDFCGSIREFTDTLGKRNFLLVGEIAGGDEFQDFYLDRLAILQRNLSAALDIGGARTSLNNVAKGLAPASEYLNLFKENTEDFGSHRSLGNRTYQSSMTTTTCLVIKYGSLPKFPMILQSKIIR